MPRPICRACAQFATVLDNETAEQRRQAARGFLAPGWSLDLALGQMRELRAPAAGRAARWSTRSLSRDRGQEHRRRLAARAPRRSSRDEVYPALDRQIAAVDALRPTRRPATASGACRSGDEIYAAALAEATTTNFTADEIHQIGLQQVAEISAELDKILR